MRTNARTFRLVLTGLMLLMILFLPLGATTPVKGMGIWFVDDDNCPQPGSGTLSDPFCRIQDAVDAALPGDMITVGKGLYAEYVNIPTEMLTLVVGGIGNDSEAFDVSDVPEEPKVNPNVAWKVNSITRLSACDNRPGLKKIYVTVLDERGEPLHGVKVRFDTEPSEGIAYDHMDVWGLTGESGYLEWDHLGVPTRYVLWMESDETALVENIRTDLGNEYCCPQGAGSCSWRPVNRPGIYSYRIEIQRKG